MHKSSFFTVASSFLLLLGVSQIAGCKAGQQIYYGAYEAFGVHKRDMMVDRVAEARDEQEAARDQFKTALEQYREVVAFDGGQLEAQYNKLNKAYENSKASANRVSGSIASASNVANALFAEWEEELAQYHDPELRRASKAQLDETRAQYSILITQMRKAEASMTPVLNVLSDQVLFLKHNLNAQAIAALEGKAASIEIQVDELVKEMETAIAQADRFLADMKEGQ